MLLFCSKFINVNSQLNDFQHVLCQISCINGLQVLSRKRGMIVGAFAGRKVQKAERVKVQVNPQGSLRWPNGWFSQPPFYLSLAIFVQVFELALVQPPRHGAWNEITQQFHLFTGEETLKSTVHGHAEDIEEQFCNHI